MTRIKVLVVDDSLFMRKLISNLLNEDDRIEVIATASNGKEALKKIQTFKPDVVTLDVEMPVLNGLETLDIIMKETPLPVIMLSNTTTEGAENTIRAIQMGAFDFVPKPSGTISLDIHKVKEELIAKIIKAKAINLQLYQLPNEMKQTDVKEKEKGQIIKKSRKKKIVLIGTSTGGPRALQEVLMRIPKNIHAPILIVQHMPAKFTKSLANRLDHISEITVKEAENGDILRNGVAYLAPGGFHLEIKKLGKTLTAEITDLPPVNGHRPSVDQLFYSAAKLKEVDIIAVILTGMGSDGTKGLKKLKQQTKTYAIAESKETAVIFGMPKSAIQTGLVDQIGPIDQIASFITNKVNLG
ncbi:protein-glutamate methylesterase/protein-glutamine glutaminase [Fervidibacillus halotolerans]|uniref:Protein-glutamate methylesterase/protein-glutamine glutaminase n=1 Tax=Fervidibacillus halotolerans TaxID=2980027 RepID=A0A9E8M379_9BACI|nr:chemotaxis response regulator protein-glutamate methylesterase [Fervidibacillus halotolerans]WAA13584.1 chemotaxis response regulator protein-glutamate methylesterase [Fervidibacillus halotolerans]